MTHGGAGRHKIDFKVRAKLKTNAWYRAALPVPSITRAMPQLWAYLSAGRAPVLLLVSAAHSQPRRWRRVATLLPIAVGLHRSRTVSCSQWNLQVLVQPK